MFDAIARRDHAPDTRRQVDRGHDMVSAYMAEHGVGFPEAVKALRPSGNANSPS